MRRKSLNEKEIRTVLAVFEEMAKMPYDKLNSFLGSLTIQEMQQLNSKLRKWYRNEEQEEM